MWESAVPASPGRHWAADQLEGGKSHVRQSFAWRPGQLQRQHSTSPSIRRESRRDFAALVPTGATHSADGHRVVGCLSPPGRKHEFGTNLKLLPSKNGISKYNRNQIYGASLLRSPNRPQPPSRSPCGASRFPLWVCILRLFQRLVRGNVWRCLCRSEEYPEGLGVQTGLLSIPSLSSPRAQRTYHNHTSLAQAGRGAMHIIITFPSDP